MSSCSDSLQSHSYQAARDAASKFTSHVAGITVPEVAERYGNYPFRGLETQYVNEHTTGLFYRSILRMTSPLNHLLAAVPRSTYQRMLTGLEPVKLIYGQVLYEPAERIRYVYFPSDCLVSLLTAVDKSRTLEVGMVGSEGMVGMPMVLGISVSAVRALVQGGGTALRMNAARFRTEFKTSVPLQRALFRYTHLLMAQVSQTAACNRFHTAGARLARWLLMTSDRLQADQFLLTQEFLAHMLGVRRVGVTNAADELKRKALIAYSRGNIRILNRERLEAAACTCYRIVKNLQDRAQA